MTTRTYTHTLDMDQLVATTVEYEKLVDQGQTAADRSNDTAALQAAINALYKAQEMFLLTLPKEVEEEFLEALQAAVDAEEEEAS
jgi:hypothetical protein